MRLQFGNKIEKEEEISDIYWKWKNQQLVKGIDHLRFIFTLINVWIDWIDYQVMMGKAVCWSGYCSCCLLEAR